MGRVFVMALLALAACAHDELDFAPPDAGRAGRDGEATRCRDSSGCAEDLGGGGQSGQGAIAGSPSREDGGPGFRERGGGPGFGEQGGGGDAADLPPGVRFQEEPDGYPTPDGQWAPWCEQMQSFNEVCGTDVDEDCDGTVDEYSGIGAPCRSGCGEGVYVCSASTNALLCMGVQGCMSPVPEPCGDGFVGTDEQCDPNAPSEQPGITCTLTCERPLFIRCVDAAVAHPERCDELHVCNERIGACMPVVGPRQPRCPQLRIEGSSSGDQFYPMLETEDGECWVTCSESEQCPSSLSQCYMGFCAVRF